MARELKDILLNENEKQPEGGMNPQYQGMQLSEDQQKEVVDIVIQDYESAIDAREQKDWGGNDGEELTWDEKYGALSRLYEDQKAARPEKWMSNRSLRIAMAIVEMMFAKLFPAVWNPENMRWCLVEFTDKEKAERITKLMKWVVTVKMRLANVVKSGVKYCIKFGNAIFKDRWVVEYRDKGEVQQKALVDEMGQPILDEMGQPQVMSERILTVDERCEVELVKLDKLLIQPGQIDIQKEPIIHILDLYYSDLELAEINGQMMNIQVIVKPEVDNRIISEMDKSIAEAEKISRCNVKRRVYPMEVLEWYGPYDANGDGFPEECMIWIDKKTKTFLGGKPLYEINKRTKRPFTKMGLLERELAFYWIGILEQVKPLADELDASMNQLIDANTLSIMRWGFYDPTGDYEPETHVAKPRSMYPVRNPNQNVYFPDIQIPIERLLNAIRLIMEFIERLTAASSYVMGKESEIVGGSGTATRTQAIVGAAQERYAIPVDNIRQSLAELLTNILCQYQFHRESLRGLETRILGEKGEVIFKPGELADESINSEMDAYILASSSMGDKNVELEIANWIYQNLMTNPLIMSSMERVYKVTEKMLKAMGEEAEYFLGKKPYTKPSDDPADEHTMMRGGTEVHPMPQEQHVYHLMQHTQKLQDPEMITWLPEAVALLQAHIKETEIMFSAIIQMMQKGGKNATPGGEGKVASGVATVQPEPGKGFSPSGSTEPLANTKKGVASPSAAEGF